MYEGDLNKTEKYENLKVDMKTLLEALNNQRDDSKWFLEFINRYYNMATLASYDSFKGVCGLLGIERPDIEKAAFYDRNSREPVDKKLKQVLKGLLIGGIGLRINMTVNMQMQNFKRFKKRAFNRFSETYLKL